MREEESEAKKTRSLCILGIRYMKTISIFLILLKLATTTSPANSAPIRSSLGTTNLDFEQERIDPDNPYVQDGLVGMWFGEDFNGVSIPARFGNVPPLILTTSFPGTVIPTEKGITTESDRVSLETASIPSVVSVYNDLSYGMTGDITFEHLADWTELDPIPDTVYNYRVLLWCSHDSTSYGGNIQWVLAKLDHTLNTSRGYFIPHFSSTFLTTTVSMANNVSVFCPELLTFTISNPNGVNAYRYLFGYSSSYDMVKSNDFYQRSYTSEGRKRFVNGSFLEVRIYPGEEFLRCAIYLKSLSDEEIEFNREVDRVYFGLPE